jgi:predicted amidohydrolase
LFVYPTGDFHVYRKSHLSTNEHYIFHPGNTLQAIPTKFGKIGFLICYDVCFPEAARKLRLDGANIIVLISAWGYDRSQNNSRAKSLEILHSYCKVRAVENQILFIMANQAG